ncbi:unnamed protein product [Ectocarpus sp. 8 AP-2014]
MAALHQATIGVMAAPKLRPLLQRAERARQKWSSLLLPEDVYALDDLVERVLRARLQVFKVESFAYNASSDVIQAEQMADAQLKTVVQEWEAMLDGLKARVEYRVSEELNSTVYPQSPALTSALQTWLSTFQADWVGNETTQQLHAHIRQRQVHQLCQTLVAKKQRLKATKDEANEFGKQRRKRDARAGSGNGMFSPSAEQAEDMAKQREFEERCQSLATAISLAQQEQIETCLTYRLFAVGQLHQRYRRLRLFFAQLGSRVGARESQATLLCGGEGQAEERIKMVGVCLMLGVVEEACLKWTAVQNERQLVEGMNREDASQDAKRRKRERAKAKVRETKTAAAAAVAAAAAAVAKAAEAPPAAVASASPSSSKEGDAVDPSPAQASAEGGLAAVPGAEAATTTSAAAAAAAEDRQPLAPGDNEDSFPHEHRRVSSGKGLGKAPAAVRNGEERSTTGWRGADRAAPPAGDEDEDGFVTIAKSKPRRSTAAAAARESSFLQHNGRPWGGGRGGGGRDGGGRGRGGGGATGGGYGYEGRDRAPRDARPYEQDRKSRAAGAAVSGGARLSSSTSAAGGWAQRHRGVVQEAPEAAPPPPPAGAGAAGGLPVAPEEELPADSAEEGTAAAAAGGVVKNGGQFGGDEVTGAEEAEEVGKAGGAAAAASSGELGPEREVAGVAPEVAKEGDGAEGGANAGAAVEEEEEEEFVFQFGTVNLSDDDAAAAEEDAGRDAGSDTAVEARHSPENLRYHGGDVDGELEEAPVVAAAAAESVPRDGDGAPSSPVVDGAEARFDGKEGLAGGESGGANGFSNENGDGSLPRQPLQTEQLRGGVFFPAHPPPAPSQQQQQPQRQPQDARLAPPPFQHHNQGAGPMQQQQHLHQTAHHHQQQQVLPHHSSSSSTGGVPRWKAAAACTACPSTTSRKCRCSSAGAWAWEGVTRPTTLGASTTAPGRHTRRDHGVPAAGEEGLSARTEARLCQWERGTTAAVPGCSSSSSSRALRAGTGVAG